MALLYTTLTQTGQQLTVRADSATLVSGNYLQLHVPPPSTCPKVKSITFKCSSHDQGFASPSSRQSSWSWGDLVVQSSNGTEIYKQLAYENAIADENFREHSGSYGEQDELVKKCAPGSILILVLRAQYAGWSNTARSAELQIKY